MTQTLTTALMLLLVATDLPAQSEGTRTNKAWGVSLTLPRGFQWAGAMGISVKASFELSGREEAVTGEMFCTPSAFVGTRIDEMKAEAQRNPADHKNLQVKEGQRFGSQRGAVLLAYVKERGADPVRLYERRHWIFRRGTMLYEWREEWPRKAASRAVGLAAVQRALKFGKPEGGATQDKQRDYVNQRARFKLPPDWAWQSGQPGKKVIIPLGTQGVNLFTVHTEILIKGERRRLFLSLYAYKSSITADQFIQSNKNRFIENWKTVKDYQIEDKIRLSGAKAQRMSFTGVNEKTGTRERLWASHTVFRHKGVLFSCYQQAPSRGLKDAKKAFKKAVKGIKVY